MNAADNKQLVRQIFTALGEGDGRPFWESATEELTYTVMGGNGRSRTYAGKQSVRDELFKPLRLLLQAAPRTFAERILADEDVVVIEARGANRTKDGAPYENRYCLIFRLREGRITAVTEYMDTELAERALGSFWRG